jgi:hypothetical protein
VRGKASACSVRNDGAGRGPEGKSRSLASHGMTITVAADFGRRGEGAHDVSCPYNLKGENQDRLGDFGGLEGLGAGVEDFDGIGAEGIGLDVEGGGFCGDG